MVDSCEDISSSAGLACNRDHFATACRKAKGMNRSRGHMNECAGRSGDGLVAVIDFHIALYDIEGFVPVMAMWWWSASLIALPLIINGVAVLMIESR